MMLVPLLDILNVIAHSMRELCFLFLLQVQLYWNEGIPNFFSTWYYAATKTGV